jgi:HEAT repeat protein
MRPEEPSHTPVSSRRRTASRAGYVGDLAGAQAALKDPDPQVRVLGVGAMARLGRLDPRTAAQAFADPSVAVRRRAIEAVAGRADVSVLALLDDPEPLVAEAASWASGERTPPEPGATEHLVVLATAHGDPLVREAAVAALGAIGDPMALPAVLAATEDRPAIRRRAVLALAAFDGPLVDAAIDRAHGDRDWQVRQAAEDVSGERTPRQRRESMNILLNESNDSMQ